MLDQFRKKERINWNSVYRCWYKNFNKAKDYITDEKKIDDLCHQAEKKLHYIPKVGDKLTLILLFIEMLNGYFHKSYTDIPKQSIIAIISALLYFLSPVDAVIDKIPIIGLLDDAAVLSICYMFVKDDVEKFKKAKKKKHILDISTKKIKK